MNSAERKIYGQTGEIGKDGLLTPDEQALLDNIQERASYNAFAYLDRMDPDDPYPMVAMATGIGKGKIIHKVIEMQMRRKPDSKVLVVAGTKLVLVKQTHQALTGYIESEEDERVDETESTEDPLQNQKSFLYRTGKLRQEDANVHIATIQTIQSELSRGRLNPKDYDLLIVDEVHNVGTSKRKATIDQFERIVGFTATPYRNSGLLKSPKQYGFIVIEPLPLPEAQRLRLLPPLVGIQIDTKGLVDEVPTTKTGTIDFAKLEKILKESPDLRPYIANRIAGIISDEDRRYKTVVVVNFVWEAQELAELFHKEGIKVGIAVNQQASKEIHTEEIPAINTIERYKLPEDDPQSIQVLISPYVVSEGFDAPATEILVWASPTDSHLRYTQYTGRLARRAEGKLFGVVVDCLYQTSQYSWSYNMGMWMKGDVVQLENGMLWLGPETDIETLKKLPQVEAIRRQADVKPLDALQKEGLLDVEENDFILSNRSFQKTFVGNYSKGGKLKKIADSAVEQLRKDHPEKFIIKRKELSRVEVFTDKNMLFDYMEKGGAKLKTADIKQVQDTDFVLSGPSFMKNFVGSYHQNTRLKRIGDSAVEQLRKDHPEKFIKRHYEDSFVEVFTDKNMLFDYMEKGGAESKIADTQSAVQKTDFVLSRNTFRQTFIGSYNKGDKLKKIGDSAVEQLRKDHPEKFIKRRHRNGSVEVFTDKKLLSDYMIRGGARLRER